VIGISNGCNDTAYVTVTVNPVPAIPVVSPDVVQYCQGATATALTATALPGHTLMWYDNAGLTGGSATAPIPSTAAGGVTAYYVTQTNSFNCQSNPAPIQVNITNGISNNVISADQALCAGTASAPLGSAINPTGGDGNFTYQWIQSTDNGVNWTNIAGATGSSFDPGATTITTSYVRVVSSGLCSINSNTVTITVSPVLTNTDIATSQTICAGTSPNLLDGQTPAGGNGTYTFQWESSPDCTVWTPIPGATGEDYQPPVLTSNTSYRRKVTSGPCEALSSCVVITVNAMPDGTITGPAAICAYDAASVSFTATAGTAPFSVVITVTGPSGTNTITQVIPNNGPATINVIPANSPAGNYTVALTSITDNIGCAKTTGLTSLPVVANAKPALVLTPDLQVCEGASATLTASGASSFTWSPATGLSATTGSTVTANPSASTTYMVIGITNDCRDTAYVTITVNPKPTNSPVPASEYCHNATATPLTAVAQPGHTLTWYDNAGLTGGSPVAPTPSTATVGSFDYFVTQTNTATGCVSSASEITVKINPVPVAAFTEPTGICMPGGLAAFVNNSTITDNTTLTYLWDFGDVQTSTQSNPSHGYAGTGPYNVTVTATSVFGCSNTSAPKVVDDFYDKPVAQFVVTPVEICQGETTVIDNQSFAPNSTVQSWNWNFGDNSQGSTLETPVKQFNNAGIFDVKLTVTNAIGCVSDPVTQRVTVHLQPVIDAGRSFVVPQGTPIQFEATANSGTLTFNWTPATSLSSGTVLKPSLTAQADQTYTLTATGDFGCTATDFLTVQILKPVKVPNVFSPNNDGIHDKWLIPNLADYPGCSVSVFNRYGQQVFFSSGYGTPWDGTMKGKSLPVGVYYYVIQLENGFKPMTGSLTIVK
jgi:gliding motility-associated-like protein